MYLTIDLGGTFIKHGVIDSTGSIVSKGKTPTPEESIEQLYAVFDQIVEEASTEHSLKGIAISAPGAVTDEGVINGVSALPYIHGPNIKEALQTRYGLSVSIENDANCAGIAEIKAGVASGLNDVLFVVCGTGIGGAVFKNGQIHKGKRLLGGEFGMIVHYDHDKGCTQSFSALASTASLVKRVADKTGQELSGTEVFRLADEGNAECKEAVRHFYLQNATLLTNLQAMYDPELIVFSGGVADRPEFMEELNTAIDEINVLRDDLPMNTNVAIAKFKNDANLLGAFFHHLETV